MSYLGKKGVFCVGNGWHFYMPVPMNMSNITFEVPMGHVLSCLKKFQKKRYSRFYSWLRAWRVLVGIMLAQRRRRGPNTIGPMYRVIQVVDFRGIKRITCMAVGANAGQSPNSVSMLSQRRIRLTGIEPAMGCDGDSTLNRYWVGRPTLCVSGTSYRRVHWLISDSGGRNRPTYLRYTCLLGSSNNYILDI